MHLSHDIFISYARGDDEPFVRLIYETLAEHGLRVWWDRVSMPSRALTFLQEIRDAIDGAGRLILVVGPGAMQSEYVRAEWQYALVACKIIIPVLRLGDYHLLPPELGRFHCPDMREARARGEAVAELWRVLGEPVLPLAALQSVPSLPPHFLPRPDDVQSLNEILLADINRPAVITSARQTAALQGMGGIGKSVLAAAFARACDTRRAFSDGIIWLTLGQQPDLPRLIGEAGAALGDEAQHYTSLDHARSRLADVLRDRACCLVLDDVWDVKHAEIFVNLLGTRCRLLITTRDGGLAANLGAQLHRLDVLSDAAALALLADWSEQSVASLPPAARAVADECGNLPFALSLTGAMARDGIPWSDLLAALREADLSFIEQQFPNYPYPDVLRSLKVGMDALAQADPAAAQRYHELAVFPADAAVPESTVVKLWQHASGMSEREARKLLATLERKALLKIDGSLPPRRISLHDLQHDYLRATLSDLSQLNDQLLTAHNPDNQPWHMLPRQDPYLWSQLAYHLLGAGRTADLLATVKDLRYLATKTLLLKAYAAESDLSAALRIAPEDAVLELLNNHFVRAGHLLDQCANSSDLLTTLYSRLQPLAPLSELTRQAAHALIPPYLAPRHPLPDLTDPALLRALDVSDSAGGCAFSADGSTLVCCGDNVIKVWDVQTWSERFTLVDQTDKLARCAVSADGSVIASSDWDGNIKVWDARARLKRFTLSGHGEAALGCVISRDGRTIVSASRDHTVRVWDALTGEVRFVLHEHANSVNDCAITPDGATIVSASEHGAIVWDGSTGTKRLDVAVVDTYRACAISADGSRLVLGRFMGGLTIVDAHTGGEILQLTGPRDWINGCDTSADGRIVAAASRDGTVRVWDGQSGQCLFVGRHAGWVHDCALSPDGQTLVSVGEDGVARVWDWRKSGGESTTSVYAKTTLYTGDGCAISPDGSIVVTALRSDLKVWDAITGIEKMSLGDRTWVSSCDISADGRFIVSVGSEWDDVKVWEARTGTEIASLPGRRCCAISADGNLILAGTPAPAKVVYADGTTLPEPPGTHALKVWNRHDGTERWTLIGHSERVMDCAISADGSIIVSASSDGTLKVWDARSGQLLHTLVGHGAYVWSCAINADGTVIVSGAFDKAVKVWDARLGHERRTLTGHTGPIAGCAITADGRLAFSVSRDKSLRVWDTASGQCLSTLYVDGELTDCCCSANGQHVAAVGEAGVYFLRLEQV